MKIKASKLIKRSIWLLVILAVLILLLCFWVAEPYKNNPFKDLPKAYSNSKSDFNCNKYSGQKFQLKADSVLNNSINLGDFMGVAAGISVGQCGQWYSSAGYQNKKKGIKADNNTLFRLASISKPFTAIAIMQLVEKGKLDLEANIQTYLPHYPESTKGDITVRQLLNHTSGIMHYKSNLAAISFKHYDNMYHALDKFKDEELKFKPGTDYLYTSYGYTVLGAILEEVTNLSYQDYMEANIWRPAKMSNTSIENAEQEYENKAHLYINFKNGFIKSPNTDLSVKYAGGGIQSTAEDMLKFGQAIINNQLIDSSSLAMMIDINGSIKKQGDPYGLGWFIESNEKDGRIIRHGGSQSGTSTYFKIYLDKKVTVVSLANSFGSNEETYFLSRELANLVLDSTAVSTSVNYFTRISKRAMKTITGKFKNADKNEYFEFTLERNQMYAELKPYPKLPIYPKSNLDYFYRHFDGKLIFSQSDDGNIVDLMYYYKGELNTFKRI